jgi:hypothetical protein
LSAIAMVPRVHSAPISGGAVSPPRTASGRPRGVGFGDRLPIALLAFLLGFAACYVVLRVPAGPDTVPYARATTPSPDARPRLP